MHDSYSGHIIGYTFCPISSSMFQDSFRFYMPNVNLVPLLELMFMICKEEDTNTVTTDNTLKIGKM